jgi:signal transduction histidine kinase
MTSKNTHSGKFKKMRKGSIDDREMVSRGIIYWEKDPKLISFPRNLKNRSSYMGKNNRIKIIFIASLISITAFFQYFTDLDEHRLHIFYQSLFFLPVFLAGFWFGLTVALTTSLTITIILLPFTFIYWNGFSAGDFNNVMEMVLYNSWALIVGILKDREKVEQKRLREAESLAATGKAVSRLAHDLKTPLVAIGILSRLMQKRLKEEDPCQEKLDLIIGEVQRLEKMVEEMLDFSRSLELHRSEKDVNQLVSQSIEIVAPIAQGKNIELRNESSPSLPLVSIDDLRIKQVIINLLMNAIEASSEGEIIRVWSYEKRKNLFIEVIDHGCGIPAEKREEIFVPFFTTKQGGTGLGLPIAKKVVEAHQGYLEVLNNSEKGSTIRVAIPLG